MRERWKGFADETFDLVVDAHLLHCIVGGDRAAVLRSVVRVLRPGGWFQVLTMCGDDPNVVQAAIDAGSRGVLDPHTRTLCATASRGVTASRRTSRGKSRTPGSR